MILASISADLREPEPVADSPVWQIGPVVEDRRGVPRLDGAVGVNTPVGRIRGTESLLVFFLVGEQVGLRVEKITYDRGAAAVLTQGVCRIGVSGSRTG